MNRKIFYWKLRESELQLGERTLIMGVLNVTPDSFSDGGRYNDPDAAYAHALELEEQGADIIDIGAESTRPGSQRISAEEEWRRLVGVLKRLRGNIHVPLSLDTYKAEIAERAMEYGVEIINDPSALTFDANLAKTAASANAGLILNHMRGTPENWAKLPAMPDPVGTIARDLEATISRARMAGVEKGRIVIDPGLGFGKRKEQNADILAHLPKLATLDHPILVGPSRKHFLAQQSENDTLYATAAAVTAAILNGAYIVRVHDVKEMLPVVHVADEIAAMAAASARAVEPVKKPVATARPRFEKTSGEVPRIPRPRFEKPAGEEARPPRSEFRPAAARDGSSPPKRPPADRPDFRKQREPERPFRSERPKRTFERGEERREFRPGAKPEFKKPEFKRPFRKDGPRFEGPKRPFMRDGKRREDGPPRGGRPPGATGGRPPKRPFRKRP
jgi:dihydropteroate synthase